jgi:hypothetical protein
MSMNAISVTGHLRPQAGPTVTLSRYGWKYDSHFALSEAREFAQAVLDAADVAEAEAKAAPDPARCGHPTERGTPCKYTVAQEGDACHIHSLTKEERAAKVAEEKASLAEWRAVHARWVAENNAQREQRELNENRWRAHP